MNTALPRVSVIVSTNGRCESLANLVSCLRYQQFKEFELCLVCGPNDDGSRELARSWQASGEIKLAYNDEMNLSCSRNAGLAIAAGEYAAFIDDDALPEAIWLADLTEALRSGDAAGAGGLVFEPNGRSLQFRYSNCNRFGIAEHGLTEPGSAAAFPFSPHFSHFMGTNCIFRRDAITALGGFDEEYQYYLEETDLCCRLVDAGFKLHQLNRAPVYHKFLSGTVRDAAGIMTRNYQTLKSQLYFSLRHARGHASLCEILEVAREFGETKRANLEAHAVAGRLHTATLDEFDADMERAWQVGLVRGLSGVPKLRSTSFFAQPTPFLPFPVKAGVRQGKHIVFLLDAGHNARDLYQRTLKLAESLVADGHLVRMVTVAETKESEDDESVDFAGGVWLHRLTPAFPADPPSPAVAEVKDQFWGRAVAVRAALDRLAFFSAIDLVEDCSASGISLAVALNSPPNLQLCLGSDQAIQTLKEEWPRGPLSVVAQRAAGVVSSRGDKRDWDLLPKVLRDRVEQIPENVLEQGSIYRRRANRLPVSLVVGSGH